MILQIEEALPSPCQYYRGRGTRCTDKLGIIADDEDTRYSVLPIRIAATLKPTIEQNLARLYKFTNEWRAHSRPTPLGYVPVHVKHSQDFVPPSVVYIRRIDSQRPSLQIHSSPATTH